MNRQPSWLPDTGGAEVVTQLPQMPSDLSTLNFEALRKRIKDKLAKMQEQRNAARVNARWHEARAAKLHNQLSSQRCCCHLRCRSAPVGSLGPSMASTVR